MNAPLLGPREDAALARRLGALSHPARLEILKQLSGNDCCCKDVVGGLNLAQSTVSQHLKVLVEAGLVVLTPSRQRSMYRIDRDVMRETAQAMAGLVQSCCPEGSCGQAPNEKKSRDGS